MSILEYLYKRYDCKNLDMLEIRCPININNLNLRNKMYKELEDLLNDIDELEDRIIEIIAKEREATDNGIRYTTEEIFR